MSRCIDTFKLELRYPKKSMGFDISNIEFSTRDYIFDGSKRPKSYNFPGNREIVISVDKGLIKN
jgi:hypothetical protein